MTRHTWVFFIASAGAILCFGCADESLTNVSPSEKRAELPSTIETAKTYVPNSVFKKDTDNDGKMEGDDTKLALSYDLYVEHLPSADGIVAKKGQAWLDMTLEDDGDEVTETVTFLTCVMIDLDPAKIRLRNTQPDGLVESDEYEIELDQSTGNWNCTETNQDPQTPFNYHFGCREITLTEGQSDFLLDRESFRMSIPWQDGGASNPGDMGQPYVDIVNRQNSSSDQDEPEPITCDGPKNKVNQFLRPDMDDVCLGARVQDCVVNQWAGENRYMTMSYSPAPGDTWLHSDLFWPEGNWITMSTSVPSPVRYVTTLRGFPKDSKITWSYPDANAKGGRKEFQYTVVADPQMNGVSPMTTVKQSIEPRQKTQAQDPCIAPQQTVEHEVVMPSSTHEMVDVDIDIPYTEDCEKPLVSGDRTRFDATVYANDSFASYVDGEFMHTIQLPIEYDSNAPFYEFTEFEWQDGILSVEAQAGDSEGMPSIAVVEASNNGNTSSGMVNFGPTPTSGGLSVFKDTVEMPSLDPKQPIEVKLIVADASHNEAVKTQSVQPQ